MSLDHILLGILKEPASGYDIKQQFDQIFRHFWGADTSQIYRTLNRLEKDAKLESWTEPSDKGPDRRVYRATEAGRESLLDWLHEGPIFGTEKFTYLAQVFFLGEANDLEWSERFFSGLREELGRTLEELEAGAAEWSQDPRYPDELPINEFHMQLTLDMGLHKTRALVAWVDKSLERIRARQQSQTEGGDGDGHSLHVVS
ncbi:MAG: PadR family transcriptional regulator [Gammaproteobacteria bacterium]|nr:PadR family transcriptional regulator [Gammaproteobacteria bacterium]